MTADYGIINSKEEPSKEENEYLAEQLDTKTGEMKDNELLEEHKKYFFFKNNYSHRKKKADNRKKYLIFANIFWISFSIINYFLRYFNEFFDAVN